MGRVAVSCVGYPVVLDLSFMLVEHILHIDFGTNPARSR